MSSRFMTAMVAFLAAIMAVSYALPAARRLSPPTRPTRAPLGAQPPTMFHTTHRGDTSTITWPVGLMLGDTAGSFTFVERGVGDVVAFADVFAVDCGQRDGDDYSNWVQTIVTRGGPVDAEIYPLYGALGSSVPVTVADNVATVDAPSFSVTRDPIYLVLTDAKRRVIQEVMFGPVAENASHILVYKDDLDLHR